MSSIEERLSSIQETPSSIEETPPPNQETPAPNQEKAFAQTLAPANGAVDDDLRQVCAELKLEVRRLSRMVERLADEGRRSERTAVLREVDGRFEWLTNQLSDRLVILGNEVVALKRHLEGATVGPERADTP